MRKRGGKRTEALYMRKIAPDRDHDTEHVSVVRDEDEHTVGTDTVGEVHEAVAKDDELQVGKERGSEVLQSSARRRCVRRQDPM